MGKEYAVGRVLLQVREERTVQKIKGILKKRDNKQKRGNIKGF